MKQDLFKTPELLPQEVRNIIEKYEKMEASYDVCRNLINELKPHGYTCDYGLEAIPYELTTIKTNQPMENKTLLVDRNAFCDWYFDYEVCKDFFYDQDILQKLKTHGTFNLDLQKILNGMDYIPASVIAEGQDYTFDEWDEIYLSDYGNVKFAE
jgi:hypothetical protein